jgi:hypothetical protein
LVNVQYQGAAFGDITFASDGSLYGCVSGILYRINIGTGTVNLIHDWCPGYFCYTTSLVGDASGNIYAAGDSLYVYNVYSGFSSNLGALPSDVESAGDMTFFEGNLYITTLFNSLALIDIQNPENSQNLFYYNTPSSIVAISTFFISCDSVFSIGATNFGDMYILDINGQTIEPAPCGVSNYLVYGLASPDEFQSSTCDFMLDLDADDSSGAMDGGFNYASCLFPAPIADDDLNITSSYHIDSIVISPANNTPWGAAYFTAAWSNHVGITGDGTEHLVLVNNGLATESDFEAAILSAMLHTNDVAPTVYTFRVSMYAASVDDPFEVWVEITFASAPQFNIGPDSTFLCFGDTVWLISDYNATPGANYSIIWQNNSISDSFAVVTSGSYIATLIVEGLVACPATDSVLVTEGAGSSFQEVIQLCEGETFYFNGHEFYADTTICAVYPNQQGCDSSHCTVLTFLPQVQISLDTAICAGDSIFLGGQYFYNPGTYQTILHNNNGCDTVLQLQLMVIQPQYNNIDTIVCEGENVVIGNQVFSDEGTFLVTLTSYLGCDSLVELNLQTVQPAIGTIYEVICQGDSIEIGGSVYYQSGSYEFHLPNWLGCDSTVILNLMVDPIVQIERKRCCLGWANIKRCGCIFLFNTINIRM